MSFISQAQHYFVRVKQSYFPKKLNAEEKSFIENNLSPEFINLFFNQALCDQRHGLLVYDKCKELFGDTISEDELLLASTMHDIAKTQSFKSVTLRIITALLLVLVSKRHVIMFAESKSKILNKIAIYADHSNISAETIAKYSDSQFVYEATKYHHSSVEVINKECTYPKQALLFINADTL